MSATYTCEMARISVDMWLDIGCPWSRISLHELERAIATVGEPVDVRFHSLRLDADAPADYGKTTIENLCDHLSISELEAEQMLSVVVEAGARVGVPFNFRAARGGNSLNAHRLLRLAADHDRHVTVATALFVAHFENGELISDHDVLQRIGHNAGLPVAAVKTLLASDDYEAEVVADEESAVRQGIERTPHFRFSGGSEASGVHSEAELVTALQMTRNR